MTTIIAVRKDGKTVIGGDCQVTLGSRVVIKSTACKVRRIYKNKVVVGGAGSVVDIHTLIELLEEQLTIHSGKLLASATDVLRSFKDKEKGYNLGLEAALIAADKSNIIVLFGSGEVMKVEEDCIGIGSGGLYAQAASKALLGVHEDLLVRNDIESIVNRSLTIAASLDVYTNDKFIIEAL